MRQEAIDRRNRWVRELGISSTASFNDDSNAIVSRIENEIEAEGHEALLDHLRFCGAMPESYRHDSTEEKIYSKYTDAVINEAFKKIGLSSSIIRERGDAADVIAICSSYSLVADAKAFRLSRSAKNQKDFKIQALDGWRGEQDFAVVVCPIYQLPTNNSQIYLQAITRNVCILSYTHLAVLVELSAIAHNNEHVNALHEILNSVSTLQPNKSALDYWTIINRTLLNNIGNNSELWASEKILSFEALNLIKSESILYLRSERQRIMCLSHRQAIDELVRLSKLDSRISQIESINHGNLLERI